MNRQKPLQPPKNTGTAGRIEETSSSVVRPKTQGDVTETGTVK